MRPLHEENISQVQINPLIKFIRRRNKKISILVVEDNEYFNAILTHELDIYARDLQIIRDFHYEIVNFTNVKKCIEAIKENKFGHTQVIAFVNYYLGDGINGAMVMKKLLAQNPENKVIIMSQTQNGKISGENKNLGAYEFIFKNNDAPFKCCLVLEQIISSNFPE